MFKKKSRLIEAIYIIVAICAAIYFYNAPWVYDSNFDGKINERDLARLFSDKHIPTKLKDPDNNSSGLPGKPVMDTGEIEFNSGISKLKTAETIKEKARILEKIKRPTTREGFLILNEVISVDEHLKVIYFLKLYRDFMDNPNIRYYALHDIISFIKQENPSLYDPMEYKSPSEKYRISQAENFKIIHKYVSEDLIMNMWEGVKTYAKTSDDTELYSYFIEQLALQNEKIAKNIINDLLPLVNKTRDNDVDIRGNYGRFQALAVLAVNTPGGIDIILKNEKLASDPQVLGAALERTKNREQIDKIIQYFGKLLKFQVENDFPDIYTTPYLQQPFRAYTSNKISYHDIGTIFQDVKKDKRMAYFQSIIDAYENKDVEMLSKLLIEASTTDYLQEGTDLTWEIKNIMWDIMESKRFPIETFIKIYEEAYLDSITADDFKEIKKYIENNSSEAHKFIIIGDLRSKHNAYKLNHYDSKFDYIFPWIVKADNTQVNVISDLLLKRLEETENYNTEAVINTLESIKIYDHANDVEIDQKIKAAKQQLEKRKDGQKKAIESNKLDDLLKAILNSNDQDFIVEAVNKFKDKKFSYAEMIKIKASVDNIPDVKNRLNRTKRDALIGLLGWDKDYTEQEYLNIILPLHYERIKHARPQDMGHPNNYADMLRSILAKKPQYFRALSTDITKFALKTEKPLHFNIIDSLRNYAEESEDNRKFVLAQLKDYAAIDEEGYVTLYLGGYIFEDKEVIDIIRKNQTRSESDLKRYKFLNMRTKILIDLYEGYNSNDKEKVDTAIYDVFRTYPLFFTAYDKNGYQVVLLKKIQEKYPNTTTQLIAKYIDLLKKGHRIAAHALLSINMIDSNAMMEYFKLYNESSDENVKQYIGYFLSGRSNNYKNLPLFLKQAQQILGKEGLSIVGIISLNDQDIHKFIRRGDAVGVLVIALRNFAFGLDTSGIKSQPRILRDKQILLDFNDKLVNEFVEAVEEKKKKSPVYN